MQEGALQVKSLLACQVICSFINLQDVTLLWITAARREDEGQIPWFDVIWLFFYILKLQFRTENKRVLFLCEFLENTHSFYLIQGLLLFFLAQLPFYFGVISAREGRE